MQRRESRLVFVPYYTKACVKNNVFPLNYIQRIVSLDHNPALQPRGFSVFASTRSNREVISAKLLKSQSNVTS